VPLQTYWWHACILANLSDEAIDALVSGLETGVYYGWTQIGELGSEVYPMVMSLGWNPYFKNERRSAVSCLYVVWYTNADRVVLNMVLL